MCGYEQDGFPDYPGVGRLYVNPGDGTTLTCTGFLIEDQRIITAAHCVSKFVNAPKDSTNGKGSFYILLGQTTNSQYVERASGHASDCVIPPAYHDASYGDVAHDWAYCAIKRPDKDNKIVIFSKQAKRPSDTVILLVSYPAVAVAKFPNSPVGVTPYKEGCLTKWYKKTHVWRYKCSTDPGTSGGPMIGDVYKLSVTGNNAAEAIGSYNLGAACVGEPTDL